MPASTRSEKWAQVFGQIAHEAKRNPEKPVPDLIQDGHRFSANLSEEFER